MKIHYLTCALDICVQWSKYDYWRSIVITIKPPSKEHARTKVNK